MKELILKAKEDSSCRLEILQAFEPLIKKCIKMYIHEFSHYEDALQQGRLILLSCIKSYDAASPYPFPAYVKKSLCYGMRDFSLKLKDSISLDEPFKEDFTLYDLLPSKDNTEEDITRKDISAVILNCINQLPEGQKKIIEDYYFKNKSMVEISQNKRCHYMSVVKQKQRALAALKNLLEVEGIL